MKSIIRQQQILLPPWKFQFWQTGIFLGAFSLVTQFLQSSEDADFDWAAVHPDQHDDVVDADQHDDVVHPDQHDDVVDADQHYADFNEHW